VKRTIAIATVLLCSCTEPPDPPRGLSPDTHPDIARDRRRESRVTPPPPPTSSEILVTINGEGISAGRLAQLTGGLGRRAPKHVYNHALGEIVKSVLLEQYLARVGFTPSSEQLEAEIARMKRVYARQQGRDAVSFEEAFRRHGIRIQQLRERPTVEMRFSCYVRSLMKEQDLVRTFETQRTAFDGTKVRARHILFDVRALSAQETRAALRKKAEAVRARALAGEDFAALAAQHSDCPSKTKGGDLGAFERFGAMDDTFAAAAFALSPGQISPLVATRFGYHIIQVTEITPGPKVSFEDVRENVERFWARRRGEEIYAEFLKESTIEWPKARQPGVSRP
jgi:parvulin-like peptidyl-prolyl isomerase